MDLLTEQHLGAAYKALNPQGLVVTQSPAINTWCGTWIADGFEAFEAIIASRASNGSHCFGSAATLADVCLIPQVESARRFQVDVARWPRIAAIDAACAQLPAFADAAPARHA